MSTLRCVGLPSSSTVSEPRRPGSVPSSITVTPRAATRWPSRPANAELPLRLKSPSSPWPTASCSSTRLEIDERLRYRLLRIAVEQLVGEHRVIGAAAAARAARLAASILLGDH